MNNTSQYFCSIEGIETDIRIEFWLGGVVFSIVGIFGIVGNVLSIVVLTDGFMINSFNKLLTALALFDLFYLLFCVTESMISICAGDFKGFNYACMSQLEIKLYPHFLHPMEQVFWTASVYMTMAISVDR